MCELYAIDSKRPVRANAGLAEFFEDSPYHPHGWGMAWREGTRFQLHKEPLTAVDSNYLAYLLDEPIHAEHLIAHIRNATRGVVSFENCHPFIGRDMTGRRWVIAHNGTILNNGLLTGYDQWIEGQTDSEQVVLFLMDLIDEATTRIGRALDFDERFVVLSRAMDTLSDFNKLNLIIDDGEFTYAHTNTKQHTLFVRQGANAAYRSPMAQVGSRCRNADSSHIATDASCASARPMAIPSTTSSTCASLPWRPPKRRTDRKG